MGRGLAYTRVYLADQDRTMQVRGCHGSRLTCRTRIDSFDWRPLLVSETVVTCLANRWREWPRAACGCWVTKRFAQGARECDGSGAWENDKADANGLVWYLVPAIENPFGKAAAGMKGLFWCLLGRLKGDPGAGQDAAGAAQRRRHRDLPAGGAARRQPLLGRLVQRPLRRPADLGRRLAL